MEILAHMLNRSPLPQEIAGCVAVMEKHFNRKPSAPPLELQRALVGFDIESTGVDVVGDRIITLAARRIDPPDLMEPRERVTDRHWRIHPGRMIPPEATRIHGITDEAVKDWPRFEAVAQEIYDFIVGCDLTGFNIVNMDVPMLFEHFFRAGIEWDPQAVKIVDASGIFQKKVPRNLSAAVKRYCGREHVGAHDAMADVIGSLDVLNGQRAKYDDLRELGVAGLAEFSTAEEYEGKPARRLDLSGLVIEDCMGVARYTHKKVRGVAVFDDIGYAEWLLNQHWIPEHSKRVLVRLLKQYEEGLPTVEQGQEIYKNF